jgi:TrmH family RNA methyltransferase
MVMVDPLGNIRIILVRPKFAGNVGAVARAMANMNLQQLCLVAPQCDPLSPDARKPGVRAGAILEAARTVQTLRDALESVTYTVATSCRGGLYRMQIEVTPRDMAARVLTRARIGQAAILFGPEDSGLTNEDLVNCDAVVRIPSSPTYPSLNLAQAVLIVAYELFLAAADTEKPVPPAAPVDRADAATLDRLMGKYRTALLKIGYLHPENPEHLLFPLRAVLGRAALTNAEARILMGMAQQMESFARQGAPPNRSDSP